MENDNGKIKDKSINKLLIRNPLTDENVITEFSIRPFAIECLK
jgi:hypothetical protein